jgi:hypothetical protein
MFSATAAMALLAGFPAQAKDLRGDAFITAMNGNTLTGKDANGAPFKLFFLPGGQATIQEGSNQPQYGSWKLDKSGDVCVDWAKPVAAESGCFSVKIDGDKVTWSNKDGSHTGGLLGVVAPLEMRKGQ